MFDAFAADLCPGGTQLVIYVLVACLDCTFSVPVYLFVMFCLYGEETDVFHCL